MELEVNVYDAAGRRVRRIKKETYDRGEQSVEWKPDAEVASGVYFLSLSSGKTMKPVKIIYLRR